MMPWPINPRPAKSLIVLRDQYDKKYPDRNKDSDGMIGDALHAARVSDHNPNAQGIVTALDITHDPKHNLDIQVEATRLVASRDERIKYVIAKGAIWQPSTGWKPYTGTDPHTNHMHISVNAFNGDDISPWNLEGEDMYLGKTAQEWATIAKDAERYKQAIVSSIAWNGDMNNRVEKINPVLNDFQQFKRDVLARVEAQNEAEDIVNQLRDLLARIK